MAATQASASVAPAEDDDQPFDVIVQIDELVKSYADGSRAKGAVHAVTFARASFSRYAPPTPDACSMSCRSFRLDSSHLECLRRGR